MYWEEDLFGMGDYSDDCIDNPSYCYDDLVYEENYGVEEVIWFDDNLGWEDETYLIDDPFLVIYEPIETVFYEEVYFQPVFEHDHLPEEVETIDIFNTEELVDIYELDLILEEDFRHEEELFTETFETIEELDEWFEEELGEEISEEEMVAYEEEFEENPEEEFEEEIFEEEVVEEIFEEMEEERIAEAEEETEVEGFNEEIEVLASLEREEGSSINREMAINLVANTIQAATNSISGVTSGTSIHATGTSSASGGSGNSSVIGSSSGNTGVASAVASSSSGGGFSTSSSPSMSDQFASASVQTNTVLSMSSDTGAVSNVSVVVTPMPTLDANPQIVMADVQVNDMQGQIDTAISGVMTTSEADQIADQIVAKNIKEQQEQAESEQEETGQYADQTTLVAFLGYVPGFDTYREAEIPKAQTWYEPKEIYTDVSISDNINAFYGLARTNISMMNSIINQQPNL